MGETVRIGRFAISGIDCGGGGSECRRDILAIFGRCVILEARYNFARNEMEYTAYSAGFDPVDRDVVTFLDHTTIPRYDWRLHMQADGSFTAAAWRLGPSPLLPAFRAMAGGVELEAEIRAMPPADIEAMLRPYRLINEVVAAKCDRSSAGKILPGPPPTAAVRDVVTEPFAMVAAGPALPPGWIDKGAEMDGAPVIWCQSARWNLLSYCRMPGDDRWRLSTRDGHPSTDESALEAMWFPTPESAFLAVEAATSPGRPAGHETWRDRDPLL